VLRRDVLALQEVVVAGAPAAPQAAPSQTRARALAGAVADSATVGQRMDAVVEVARLARDRRVLAAVGCYALSTEPGGAAPSGVGRLALDDRPTTRRAGRQSYAARLAPSVAGAEWTPIAGDSVRVAWSVGAGSVVLRLTGAGGAPGGVLHGTARALRGDGAPAEAPRRVAARPTSCETIPPR
jgi:hypothetical protein